MKSEKQEIKIEAYNGPKELKSSTIEDLICIVRRAFSASSFPTRKDTLSHIGSSSSLVIAFKDKPIGFCSIKNLDRKTILHHAIAVDPEHQSSGVGTRLLDLAATNADTESEFFLGGRTQNPFYINYIRKHGGYPREDQITPKEIQTGVRKLADFYPGNLRREEHLLEKSYVKPPYCETEALKAEKSLENLVGKQISFLEGDAILPVTKTSKSAIEKKAKQNL